MNILILYKSAVWLSTHVLPEFQRLNGSVTQIDMRKGGRRQAITAISESQPDFVFAIEPQDDWLSASDIEKARSAGTKVICWLVDVPQDWYRSVGFCKSADIVLVAQQENSNKLKSHRNRVVQFPFALSDNFLTQARTARIHADRAATGAPLFVGSAHSDWRKIFVRYLDTLDVAIDVAGAGWTGDATLVGSTITDRARHFFKMPTASMARRILSVSGSIDLMGGLMAGLQRSELGLLRNVNLKGPLSDAEFLHRCSNASCLISTGVHGSSYVLGLPKNQFKLRDIEMSCFGVPHIMQRSKELEMALPEMLRYSYSTLGEIRERLGAVLSEDVDETRKYCRKVAEYIEENHRWRNRFGLLSDLTGSKWQVTV
jgi:hypothetical protein